MPQSRGKAPGTHTVLLVDDYTDTREMYEACLRHAGYEVLTAANAHEAIDLAERAAPDIILMDAGMPGMNGWDAVRVLKEGGRTRQIPTLMLTGHVLAESRRVAEECGADGFIPKPCLPDDLIAQIRSVLTGRRRTASKGQSPQA